MTLTMLFKDTCSTQWINNSQSNSMVPVNSCGKHCESLDFPWKFSRRVLGKDNSHAKFFENWPDRPKSTKARTWQNFAFLPFQIFDTEQVKEAPRVGSISWCSFCEDWMNKVCIFTHKFTVNFTPIKFLRCTCRTWVLKWNQLPPMPSEF